MAPYLPFLALPLCLLLLLTLEPLQTAAAATAQPNTTHIKEACSHTLHSALCIESLQSDPKSLTADHRGLASIALDVAATNAAETSAYIAALLQDTLSTEDSGLQQCLTDCSEHYMDAVAQLDNSHATLDSEGSYDNVITLVSAAMSDASACNDGCKQVATGPNAQAVEKKNWDLFKLCNIALVLAKLAQKA